MPQVIQQQTTDKFALIERVVADCKDVRNAHKIAAELCKSGSVHYVIPGELTLDPNCYDSSSNRWSVPEAYSKP
ncbi:MAG: hypothetical protein WB681_12110 [Candidatus Cybelea sp.]